jgi:protein subunit release factor A
MKEMVQDKSQKNIELENVIKNTNIMQLQDEITNYSKQYKKLEDLTKFTIDLAKKNGFEEEVLKDKRAHDFLALSGKGLGRNSSKDSFEIK